MVDHTLDPSHGCTNVKPGIPSDEAKQGFLAPLACDVKTKNVKQYYRLVKDTESNHSEFVGPGNLYPATKKDHSRRRRQYRQRKASRVDTETCSKFFTAGAVASRGW